MYRNKRSFVTCLLTVIETCDLQIHHKLRNTPLRQTCFIQIIISNYGTAPKKKHTSSLSYWDKVQKFIIFFNLVRVQNFLVMI